MVSLRGHRQCTTVVKLLALASIEKANSGHPGVVLGFADVLTVLWRKHMRYDLADASWQNRDRFVLSNGHASALYYAILHCCGFDLTLDDLKSFRQLGSRTPGHPERDPELGIDVSTGPLGQGLANAVGMSLAQKYLESDVGDKSQNDLIDYYTYVAVGDGCLMEGISHEACSLAGRFSLGRLIVCWDDNGISIDGECENWSEKSVAGRFLSYGWQVIDGVDGHDPDAIDQAIIQAKACLDKPTLICFKTVIGHGTDLAGSSVSHGKPLGRERIECLKRSLQWSLDDFSVPESLYELWHVNYQPGLADQWYQAVGVMAEDSLLHRLADFSQVGGVPDDWEEFWRKWLSDPNLVCEPRASRHSSQWLLRKLMGYFPSLLGGSADLSESTGVLLADELTWFPGKKPGPFLSFGVREFAMFAIANGLATCMGLRPFVSTFLVFSDYGINAVRMAAMMKIPVLFIFSHDSIYVGEDGPTHQPIEQLAHLRSIPNLDVWRPADAFETGVAWKKILECNDRPSCLVLSRQKLPSWGFDGSRWQAELGAYRLDSYASDCHGVLIATGSELALAMAAQKKLLDLGVRVGVVSMLCVEWFLQSSHDYQEQVLPKSLRYRVILEAGSGQCWYQFLQGMRGRVLSIEAFGSCGPGQSVYEMFGFHVDAVCDSVLSLHEAGAVV